MTERTPEESPAQQLPDWHEQWFAEEAVKPHLPKRSFTAITVLLFLVALASLTVLSDFSQNPAGLCGACHTMRPYYYTWQASSHSQLSCLACHAEPGLQGTFELAQDLARFSYVQATRSYILPIRLFAGLGDDVCLRCHTFTRVTTATGDLIIPHAEHTQSRVRCIDCHDGVAHGNIAQRRAAVNFPAADWDLPEGRRQMVRAFTAAPKEDCMSCHHNRRVDLSCQGCHQQDKTPADHLADNFLLTHGALAREVADCHLCHAYDARGRKIKVQPGENLISYTRRNDFCLDCHRQRPPSHEPDFRNHRVAATNKVDSCFVCHDNQPQGILPEASLLFCGACHPSPHRDGWQARHNRRRRGPITILPGQALVDSCFACHPRANCLSCHTPPPGQDLPRAPETGLPALPQGEFFF